MLVGWDMCESTKKNYGSKEEEACGSKDIWHDGVLVEKYINV